MTSCCLWRVGWESHAWMSQARGVEMLSKPRRISDAGLDGMYFYKGSLVGIQNPDLHPGRVMRCCLNSNMDQIEHSRCQLRQLSWTVRCTSWRTLRLTD